MNFISEIDAILGQLVEDTILNTVMQQSVNSYQDELFRKQNGCSVALTPQVFEKDEETQCFICLCPIRKKEMVYVLPCGHEFHQSCLEEAVSFQHKNCCICRQPFPVDNTSTENETPRNGHVIIYEEPTS